MSLVESWRWYGPNDPVSLDHIMQAGAKGIVNALHHIPVGEEWPLDEILKRKQLIEWDETRGIKRDLRWLVVESVNVHESIKQATADRDRCIDNYIRTIYNLAEAGINIVCYNFMPVIDWTRTDLDFELSDHSLALRFDMINVIIFDLYILKRANAAADYSTDLLQKAEQRYASLSSEELQKIESNILAGLPGSLEAIELSYFKSQLNNYKDIDADALRQNLVYFLKKVVPAAEACGVRLCIHPDDPPYPIFGLPRVVSTEEDLAYLTSAIDSPSNGITFCTGSLGPRSSNNLVQIITNLGHKFHFLHLRNIKREADGSFYESDHLDGSVDMCAVMHALLREIERRNNTGQNENPLPFRPDHGHQMLDDLSKKILFPGYSAIGRLRGLAELRGLKEGLSSSLTRT